MSIGSTMLAFRPILLLAAALALAAADSAPTEASSITQHGITWTFDRPYPVGRYVTGDWYVVGPARVVAVSPVPEAGRNGSVVDPVAGKQGYDDRAPCFAGNLRASFPLDLKPDQSLVSSASLGKVGERTPDLVGGHAPLCPIRTAAVLTCEAARPPDDAFRPAYVGTWRERFRASALRRDLLPRLKAPAEKPDPRRLARMLDRIWPDHLAEHMGREMHPVENMPGYGREISTFVSEAALAVLLEDPDRSLEPVLLRFVQKGIDLNGMALANPRLWTANGGHNPGRKWPIVFAGLMLDHAGMQQVQASFHEDEQTYHGKGFHGQTALWRIGPKAPNAGHEEVDPKTWKTFGGGANNGDKAEAYRNVNGPAWVGQALAARLMGATKVWNHQPYFDYVDRWCRERGDKSAEGLARAMWLAYRDQADAIGAESERKRLAGKPAAP